MTGRKTREERVQAVVDAGYSREFAEAYVPMTLAEARAKQLEVRQYESDYMRFQPKARR